MHKPGTFCKNTVWKNTVHKNTVHKNTLLLLAPELQIDDSASSVISILFCVSDAWSEKESSNIVFRLERKFLDWNVYSFSNLCWWYDAIWGGEKWKHWKNFFPAKTKLSCWPAGWREKQWFIEKFKMEGRRQSGKVRKQGFFFFSLFLCSMLMLSDAQNGLNQPSRVLTGLNHPPKSPNGLIRAIGVLSGLT